MDNQDMKSTDITLPEEQQAMDTFKELENMGKLDYLYSFIKSINNPPFLYRVGMMLLNGTHGAEKDEEKAYDLFKKATTGAHCRSAIEMEKIRNRMAKQECGNCSDDEDHGFNSFLDVARKTIADNPEFDASELKDADNFFNEYYCGGELFGELLDDIDEFTNSQLIYECGNCFKYGNRGFEKDDEKAKACFKMAGGYFHVEALHSYARYIDDFGLQCKLKSQALTLWSERMNKDPLYKEKCMLEVGRVCDKLANSDIAKKLNNLEGVA